MQVNNTKPVVDFNNYVHKRLMALEVYNRTKRCVYLEMSFIIGVVFIFGFLSWHLYAGAGAGAIFVIFMAVFFSKDVMYMKYLEEKYQLKAKKNSGE